MKFLPFRFLPDPDDYEPGWVFGRFSNSNPNPPKSPVPKLVLSSEWRDIAKELRRQLKPFGLTVKTRTSRAWGDLMEWKVSKI